MVDKIIFTFPSLQVYFICYFTSPLIRIHYFTSILAYTIVPFNDSPFLFVAQVFSDSNYKKVNFTKVPRFPKKPRLNVVRNQRPSAASVIFKVIKFIILY